MLTIATNRLRTWTLFCVVLFSLFGSSMLANAQAQPASLGIKPVDLTGSYFTLTLAPGETRELTVELANFGTAKTHALTYAADVYSIVNGGFGATLDGEPTNGATRWLDYPTDTLELEARAGIHRSFKVSVPADAKPGDYITSLVIQSADAQAINSTGVAVKQVVRQAIAVAIHIPGPQVAKLEIGDATYRTVAGKSLIAVAVKNTGNVHLKPSGNFVLRDESGAEISHYPIAMDTLYAGSSTFIEVPFAGRLDAGNYNVSLSLADEKTHVDANAKADALSVPPETDDAPAAIGEVPQPAPINQTRSNSTAQFSHILIGVCLVFAMMLVGIYGYRQQRRKKA